MTQVLIIGAGGHAQVVADILKCSQACGSGLVAIGYLDDNPQLISKTLLGLSVLGKVSDSERIAHDAVIVAVGDNETRRRLYRELTQRGEKYIIAKHPTAIVAADVLIGSGTMICAGVIVNTGSMIGENVILNTGCSIDHHNRIASHVHIAPGVHLGGEVNVGDGTLIGIGATVMPRCYIGERVQVGAGACVTRSISPGLTVVGVPAKPLQKE